MSVIVRGKSNGNAKTNLENPHYQFTNLRLGLFSTAAVDNIDHNPSSTTAKDSFHGTGISLFQHSSAANPGTAQERISISDKAVIKELPPTYTDVAPVEALT